MHGMMDKVLDANNQLGGLAWCDVPVGELNGGHKEHGK